MLNNKLNYIADNQGVTHANIGDLGSQNANNYTYDAIGQLTQDAAEGVTNVVWNIQAKVERVDFGNGKPTVYYTYDAQGNRLTKKVNNATTYYIRDAKGNILATYEQNIADIVLAEQHLYGSARLGLRKANILVKNAGGLINPDANRRVYTRSVGHKSYEQTNHLGDVVVTLSDKVLLQGADYQAIVRNAGLSYPFGWEIPERSYTSAGGYRFGFNGKENDAETGWQDYGFRLHDRRICRFISVDPLTAEYPWYTPYQFAGNTPIEAIDLDGAEPLHLSATRDEWEYGVLPTEEGDRKYLKSGGKRNGFTQAVAGATFAIFGKIADIVSLPSQAVESGVSNTVRSWMQSSGWEFGNAPHGLDDAAFYEGWRSGDERSIWEGITPEIVVGIDAIPDIAGKTSSGIIDVAMAYVGLRQKPAAPAPKTETYYRAMSPSSAKSFMKTGRMSAGEETFISPTKDFAANYEGILFEIKLNHGTTSQLEKIGVRNKAQGHPYRHLPLVEKGWKEQNAFFKSKGKKHISIGLGNGEALNLFNENIQSYRILKR